MTAQGHDDAISFIAGEDLATGDLVAVDPETGKVIRCPADTRCLVTVSRDYQAGEVVEFPAEDD